MTLGTEYELDPVTMQRTGRSRRRQFKPTKRLHAVPPSKRGDEPFT